MRVRMNLALDGLAERADAAARTALWEAGEHIRMQSAAVAPRRSGAMIASARTEVSGNRARVSYHAPYAACQHEDAGLRHPNGGRARFLSSVAESPEAAAFARRALAAALRREFH